MSADAAKPSTRPIRVIIADDHELMRQAVAAELDRQPDIRVVASVGTAAECVHAYRTTQPDVVLCDYSMPNETGVDAAREILEADPQAQILILSAFGERDKVQAAVSAGVRGYVIKDLKASGLADRVRQVAAGSPAFDERSVGALADALRGGDEAGPPEPHRLTGRQREILRAVADGLSTDEIAERLSVSPETVKTHMRRAAKALGVNKRAAAVAVALTEGLLDDVTY